MLKNTITVGIMLFALILFAESAQCMRGMPGMYMAPAQQWQVQQAPQNQPAQMQQAQPQAQSQPATPMAQPAAQPYSTYYPATGNMGMMGMGCPMMGGMGMGMGGMGMSGTYSGPSYYGSGMQTYTGAPIGGTNANPPKPSGGSQASSSPK